MVHGLFASPESNVKCNYVINLTNSLSSSACSLDNVIPTIALTRARTEVKSPGGSVLKLDSSDLLASTDLLILIWYAIHARVSEVQLGHLKGLPEYVLRDGLVEPKISNRDDIDSQELCVEAYEQLLAVVNMIREELGLNPKPRLPENGPAGLALFLLQSCAKLHAGPYLDLCGRVITHISKAPANLPPPKPARAKLSTSMDYWSDLTDEELANGGGILKKQLSIVLH